MQYRMVGLGDVIASITDFFGIHPLGNCGCNERRQFLNRFQVAILV